MNFQSFDMIKIYPDNEQFLSGFCKLLAKESRRFAGCDRTSVSVERADSLSKSILYTIGINTAAGMSPEEILHEDPEKLLLSGRQIIKEKKAASFAAWKALLQKPPRVRNVFFTDTVKGLGAFFKYYDIFYSAHCIPCSIDYWTMIPMQDSLKGISYIEEYLRRLSIEVRFLHRFSPETVRKLYSYEIPEYHSAFFNLCEPIVTAALIRKITGKFLSGSFNITDQSAAMPFLRDILAGKDNIDIIKLIENSIASCCVDLELSESDTEYLLSIAPDIAARLRQKEVSNGVKQNRP